MPEFTPEEANALVPSVRPVLVALREAFHEFSFAREQWSDAERAGDGDEAARWRAQAEERGALVQKLVDDLRAVGCAVKDPTLGLVDFPTRRGDGTLVLLCYRDDEDAIRFWHPLEGGYAARRPLGEL